VAALSCLPVPIPGFGSTDCVRCRSHLLRWPAAETSSVTKIRGPVAMPEPERPRSEPEIIPPGRAGQGATPRERIDTQGTERI